MKHKGLGRKAAPDPRDRQFLLADILPTTAFTSWKYWYDSSWRGDQGVTPQCVAYAWSHFYTGSPLAHAIPFEDPSALYAQAQANDEWPGSDYDGTSVRGGAKAVLLDGRIADAYAWAFDVQTMANTIGTHGPVVVGTNWYDSMFEPRRAKDALGDYHMTLVIDPDSPLAGGHAWLVNGVNVPRRTFRMLNSWGLGWGVHGRATVGFDTMERLLDEQGEACMALEIKA